MNPGYKPEIKKQEDSGNVYYIVNWSALQKADKYDIIKTVPSVSGIYELYYMDEKKKLNLFYVSKAWYGGLRHSLRKLTDPELVRDPARHKVLNDYDCYYRYSLTNSYADMSDIIYFFARTYFPPSVKAEHSGRYIDIFVDEHSPDKIITI